MSSVRSGIAGTGQPEPPAGRPRANGRSVESLAVRPADRSYAVLELPGAESGRETAGNRETDRKPGNRETVETAGSRLPERLRAAGAGSAESLGVRLSVSRRAVRKALARLVESGKLATFGRAKALYTKPENL